MTSWVQQNSVYWDFIYIWLHIEMADGNQSTSTMISFKWCVCGLQLVMWKASTSELTRNIKQTVCDLMLIDEAQTRVPSRLLCVVDSLNGWL